MPSAPYITLLHKGSNVPNRVPLVADLKHKELAVNYYDGVFYTLKSDNTVVKFINAGQHPHVLNTTLSASFPQFGNNTASNNALNGAIVGGTDNYLNHPNSFIMGSGISSISADYTFVNNLSSTAKIEPSELILRSDNGTKWRIVVSNSGVISAIDTNQLVSLYWYDYAMDGNWFNQDNWFTDSYHSVAANRLPTSSDGVYILGPSKPSVDLDANWANWINPGFIDLGTFGMDLSGTNKTISVTFRGTGVSFYGSITVTNP